MPNVTFVTLDDDFAKTPWEAGILEKLAGSLLVFDDIAKLAPLVLIKVMRLLDEAMHDGRHNNIYIIVTSHMITDYKATRSILNEATSVTFFPMVNQKQTENFLKSYGGFLTKQIREVKALDTRSCTFFKGYPTIILYDHGVYLPNAIVKN